MRKKIMASPALVLLALFALCGQALAQSKGFAFGFKGGINLSKLSMGEVVSTRYDSNGNPYLNYNGQEVRDHLRESLDSRTGFVGGIYLRFGRNLFFQPELLASKKGGVFDIVQTDNNSERTSQVKVNFKSIDVPLLVGLKGGPFRLNAGPMVSFRRGDNERLKEAFRHYTTQGLDESLSEAVYGYQLGAGLDIFRLSIDVRKEGSFSNVASFGVNHTGSSTSVKQKLNSWQVTVGIKLI
jgi:hypothetical protein